MISNTIASSTPNNEQLNLFKSPKSEDTPFEDVVPSLGIKNNSSSENSKVEQAIENIQSNHPDLKLKFSCLSKLENCFPKLHMKAIAENNDSSYFINSNAIVASCKVNYLHFSKRCPSPEERLTQGVDNTQADSHLRQQEVSIKKYTRRKSCKGGSIFGEINSSLAQKEKLYPLTIVNMHVKRILLEATKKKKKSKERALIRPIKRALYCKDGFSLKQPPLRTNSSAKSLFNQQIVQNSQLAAPSTPTNQLNTNSSSEVPIQMCKSTAVFLLGEEIRSKSNTANFGETVSQQTSNNETSNFQGTTQCQNLPLLENSLTSNGDKQIPSLSGIGMGSPQNNNDEFSFLGVATKQGFDTSCSLYADKEDKKQGQLNQDLHIPLGGLNSPTSRQQQQQITQQQSLSLDENQEGTVEECYDDESNDSPQKTPLKTLRFQRLSTNISNFPQKRKDSFLSPQLPHHRSRKITEGNLQVSPFDQSHLSRCSVVNVVAPPIRKASILSRNCNIISKKLSLIKDISDQSKSTIQLSQNTSQNQSDQEDFQALKSPKNAAMKSSLAPPDGLKKDPNALCKNSISFLQKNPEIQTIVQEYLDPGCTEEPRYSPNDPLERTKNMKNVFVTATNLITLQNKVKANNAFYRNYYNLVGKISLDDNIQYLSQLAEEVLASPSNKQKDKVLCAPKCRQVFIHKSSDDKVKLVCSINKLNLNKTVQRFIGDSKQYHQQSVDDVQNDSKSNFSASSFSYYSSSFNSSKQSFFPLINEQYGSQDQIISDKNPNKNSSKYLQKILNSKENKKKSSIPAGYYLADEILLNKHHKRNFSEQGGNPNKKQFSASAKNPFQYSTLTSENLTPYLKNTSPRLAPQEFKKHKKHRKANLSSTNKSLESQWIQPS